MSIACDCEGNRQILFIKAVLTSGCACPGDTLTYECTVVGGPRGVTVWTGSGFDCAANEIVLSHKRFLNGTFGSCNNGAIVARSVSVEGNNYISQLNVSSDIAGKTIKCLYDNGTICTIIFSIIISTTGLSPCMACQRHVVV